MKIEVIKPDSAYWGDLLILHKQNAKTLGMFPEGAFVEHARKRWLFGAFEDEKLIGYLLFRITKRTGMLNITHLCIKSDCRRSGVANKLLDLVKAKYENMLRGMRLSCRKDYGEASSLWKSYGFLPYSIIRSRSKEENYLIVWYYDFKNVDLFSDFSTISVKGNAQLDANIIVKMSDEPSIENSEAQSLSADWLVEETNYYYGPEMFNELDRDKDLERAAGRRRFLHTLLQAPVKTEKFTEVMPFIEQLIPGISDNDVSDRRQLAEAIAASMEYFITMDEGILDIGNDIYKRYSLKVVRPADFILYIDEDINGRDYGTYRLTNPEYIYCHVQANDLSSLTEHCFLHNGSEKRHLLMNRLAGIIADLKNSVVRVIKDREGMPIAYFGVTTEDDKVLVKAIRTKACKIAYFLFQQLIRDIVAMAIESNCPLILVDDNVNEEQSRILFSFGFQWNGTQWYKIQMEGLWDFHEVLNFPSVVQYWNVDKIKEKLTVLEASQKKQYKIELERKLWPVKFKDIEIPVYIVPIRPHWAAQLFDYLSSDNTLFGAKPELSWSKENIYYRSVKPVSELAPARILWYVSSDPQLGSARNKGIVATSYLDDVYTGEAKRVFKKYQNYGIYEWSDILKLAKNDARHEIKALKFTDSEVFKKPVYLAEIERIMQECGQRKNTFASPVRVSSEIFYRIYMTGKQLVWQKHL